MSQIITLGNELLKQKSGIITDFSKNLEEHISMMFETLAVSNGIGLASVQLGDLRRLFVTSVPKDKPRVFINPEIIETSLELEVYEEGCLSIPGINSDVTRPFYVRIQAWDVKEKHFTIQAEGLLARVIQHEIDHINGLLFIDHLDPDRKQKLIDLYNRKKKH